MSIMAAPQLLTGAEYLRMEREASERHEFANGVIRAMAGGTRKHSLIKSNLTYLAQRAWRGGSGCTPFESDLRVSADLGRSYFYPDLTIVCGQSRFEDSKADILTNPTVIFEVLSPSTEAYDRGQKFQHYRQIDSLKAYVLIASESERVEVFTRQDDSSWALRDWSEGTADVGGVDLKLSIEELYAGVADLEATPDEA